MGDKIQTLTAAKGAKEFSFDLELVAGRSHPVIANLLDRPRAMPAGGDYVYCGRENR